MPQNNAVPDDRIWCAIPVLNNQDTLRGVVAECRAILKNVVVVDDGSTDADVTSLLSGLDVVVLKHDENRGKGQAILTASRYVEAHGGVCMITIDADGQHYPRDMEQFVPLIRKHDSTLFIGSRNFDADNVPHSSKFGRRFANFWLRVETGVVIDDCQSGFRAYPVAYLNRMTFKGSHYDFEAEVLAKAVWAGLQLKTVPIAVRYPRPAERVSSFKPLRDNLRLTLIHSMLVGRRLLPLRHKRLMEGKKKIDTGLFRHPGAFLKKLLREQATPGGLAFSAAVGTFIAVLPLLFVHTVVILYVSVRLNLNKIVAVNVQHLAMPPFVPALCIEVGHYLKHGKWLTNLSFETVFEQFSDRLLEWFLGSLLIAPVGALVVGVVMYTSATLIKKLGNLNAS